MDASWIGSAIAAGIGVIGGLLGVVLGDRLASRHARHTLYAGWFVDLRRLLSRELDNVLLVQRRFQHETGPREEAVARWRTGAVRDESELTFLLDICDVGNSAERVALIEGQTALGTALQSGDEKDIAGRADSLVRLVMRAIAQIDVKLGIKSGTRGDWERGWDGDLSPRNVSHE